MLYFVGTPIGNLEDLSARALRVLREAEVIGAEDTRHTRKLLTHFEIHTPLLSFHQHNERERTEEFIRRLRAGATIAVVSDAGMPLISDAGQLLRDALIKEQLPFTCIPGPSAVDTALVLSGLPAQPFQFLGFVPREAKPREQFWQRVVQSEATSVMFESPQRLLAALTELAALAAQRQVAVARELTKVHEEIVRGTPAEVQAVFEQRGEVKGECVLLVAPAAPAAAATAGTAADAARMVATVQEITGVGRAAAVRVVAALTGLPRNALYEQSLQQP